MSTRFERRPLKLLSLALEASAALACAVCVVCAACSSGTSPMSARPVAAVPPPKDDGAPSGTNKTSASEAADAHSAALEQLKIAKIGGRLDKQASIVIPLPDPEHWTRVKFWGVESLVGFRYGKEHHAIVGAFVMHVDDNTVPGACTKSFEAWAMPMVDAFDVDVKHDPPIAVMWHRQVVDVDSVFAQTATALMRESYAGAYAAYPVWKNACLIVGMAAPSRDDEERAREVRDRFAKEVLPRVEVLRKDEPPERY